MTTERTLFLQALELPTAEARAAFLGRHCGGQPGLRQRIEALLKAHAQGLGPVDALGNPNERTSSMLGHGLERQEGPETDPDDLSFLDPAESPEGLGKIGAYEVLEVLGRGGMGVVFKARDPKLHRIVAIKVLAPSVASHAAAKKRFEREAQAAAAVSHDHIVTIHAVDEHRGLPYLVMECIVGRTLQQKIDQTGPLELKEILRIGIQAAQGLAAAHRQGLVHRDIKPANILLQNGVQRVKLTDFGLARLGDDIGMTQTGQIAGTPLYMSPEQAQGLKVDHLSDLFSLGSVLYTMATGRPAFRAGTAVAVLRRVVDDVPRPVHEVNEDLPTWLSEIVARLMSKDKDARFQTADELAELLSRRLAKIQEPRTSTTTAKPATIASAESAPNPPAASVTRRSRPTAPLQPVPRRNVKAVATSRSWWARLRQASALTWMVGLVLVPGMLTLLIMIGILLTRDQLQVRIEFDEALRDQDVTVVLDGVIYAARDLGSTVRVKPGRHTLAVNRGDDRFESEELTILRNEEPLFRVKMANGKLAVERVDPGTSPVALANIASPASDAPPLTVGRTDTPEYQRFVEWIKSRGGSVTPEYPPDGALPHIVSLAIQEPFIPSDFEHFKDLPGVQNALGILSPNLSSADMIALGRAMQGKPIYGGTGLVDIPIGLEWLKEPGGFRNSSGFTFQHINAEDEQLRPLKDYPRLETLNLRHNEGITDAGIPHLIAIKTLRHLHLEGTKVSEAGRDRLMAELPGCEVTPGTAATASGVTGTAEYKEFVKWMRSRGGAVNPEYPSGGGLPEMVSLSSNGPFTQADMEQFRALPGVGNMLGIFSPYLTTQNLIQLGKAMEGKPIGGGLSLVNTPVGLDWLKEPGGFAVGTNFIFQNCEARDEQLSGLKNLPKLKTLTLRFHPAITDAGIVYLEQLTTLEHLHLDFTGITEDGLKRLRLALPKCEVTPALP